MRTYAIALKAHSAVRLASLVEVIIIRVIEHHH